MLKIVEDRRHEIHGFLVQLLLLMDANLKSLQNIELFLEQDSNLLNSESAFLTSECGLSNLTNVITSFTRNLESSLDALLLLCRQAFNIKSLSVGKNEPLTLIIFKKTLEELMTRYETIKERLLREKVVLVLAEEVVEVKTFLQEGFLVKIFSKYKKYIL